MNDQNKKEMVQRLYSEVMLKGNREVAEERRLRWL